MRSRISKRHAPINDVVNGVPIAVLWGGSTADALDETSITDSRAIGTGVAFLAELDGLTLTFHS